MSTNYTAHAIIGVKLPLWRMYRTKTVRVCSHELPPDAQYCPKCGKPAYQIDSEAIYSDFNNTLGQLTVVLPTEQEYAIVGLAHCEVDAYDEPEGIELLPLLPGMYETIERELRKYELWDGQSIRLYSVLDCS
jgi:hypothetical protein